MTNKARSESVEAASKPKTKGQALTYKQQEFCDLYLGGGDKVRGNATACYRHTHPNASDNTCMVNGSRLLRNAKVKRYLAAKAQLLSKKTTMNASKVLAESIEMLAMAKGLLPQINETLITVKNEDGEVFKKTIRTELCTTNLAMVARSIELIGRNIGGTRIRG